MNLSSPYFSKTVEANGRNVLKYFHNSMAALYGDDYPFQSIDETIDEIKKQRGAKLIEEHMGDLQSLLNLTDSQVESAMSNLARASGGRFPNWNSFTSAMSGKAQEFSFLDAASYTVTESAKTIVSGVAEAGDAAIVTLKAMKFLIPALVIGGVAWIGYSYIRKTAGR